MQSGDDHFLKSVLISKRKSAGVIIEIKLPTISRGRAESRKLNATLARSSAAQAAATDHDEILNSFDATPGIISRRARTRFTQANA